MRYLVESNEADYLARELRDTFYRLAPGYVEGQDAYLDLDEVEDARRVYLATDNSYLRDRIAREVPQAADPKHAATFKPVTLTEDEKQLIRKQAAGAMNFKHVDGLGTWKISKLEADTIANALRARNTTQKQRGWLAVYDKLKSLYPQGGG